MEKSQIFSGFYPEHWGGDIVRGTPSHRSLFNMAKFVLRLLAVPIFNILAKSGQNGNVIPFENGHGLFVS